MTKIAFYGVGGVGGYFAAQMISHYQDRKDIQFYCIARGAHLEAIQRNGLTLRADHEDTITAIPTSATDDPASLGVMDYIIYTTKSYSIPSNIDSLRAITGPDTVILTFMNGVDGYEILKKEFPCCTVCDGCVYIVSRIAAPGIIEEKGGKAHFFFGSDKMTTRVKNFTELASAAVKKISYEENITHRVWKKFSFISVFATLTTYHNITNTDIRENPEFLAEYKTLSEEFQAVAKAIGTLPGDQVYEDNVKLLTTTPDGTTSSMQRDFWTGKPSELDSLTGYIMELGNRLSVDIPTYEKIYRFLKNRPHI